MSFWDNMKRFTSSYGEEEELDEEDYGEEPFEEEPRTHRTTRRAPEPTPTVPHTSGKAETGSFNGKVLNMNNNNKASVVLFRPTCSNDATQAADDLRDKKAVIVNMENVDTAVARRVVDFLSGCAYALEGKVMKIAQATYLFCPKSMDVSGDLEVSHAESETNA